MILNPEKATGNGTAGAAAQIYTERGWRPLRVYPRDKAPVDHGWQNDPAPVPANWRGNVGVLLGAPSGGLVDVDLDHHLAVELADKFLPPTASEFGRASKPRSHRLYYVTGDLPKTKRHESANGDALVEFRSTGCQTVFPGSIHPSGEPIEWDNDGEPASVPVGLLVAAVNALADEVRRRIDPPAKPKQSASQRQSASTSTSGAIDRARKYIAKMPSAISGQGGHNAAFSVACVCYRFGLADGEAWQLLAEYNGRCEPPWSESELQHKLESARERVEAAGEIGSMPDREHQQDNDAPVDFDALLNGQTSKPKIKPQSARDLIEQHPELHAPIIHGLLRRGETANIIAAPKVGKSWLVYGLTLSIASGQKWLNQFDCEPGRVLLIDNELHQPTLASRLRTVADHLLTPFDDDWPERLDILSLRGHLESLTGIAGLLAKVPADAYDLIVLDAWYRAIPAKVSENDNAAVANLYNLVDQLAARLDCAWVNIHHSSKGSQTEKSVTDVGAGAGSQSRAADAHIVLREHEDEGAVVLDAVVRSLQFSQFRCGFIFRCGKWTWRLTRSCCEAG